jgi:hypothetical protein
MSLWLREVFGWVLVGLGLAVFALCYFVFIANKRVIEAGPIAFIGFIVFRGGLHLLKVAIAAKACRDAGREARTATPVRKAISLGKSVGPAQVVVPGPKA